VHARGNKTLEKKGNFFIFLLIIAILTLIIAALVSFIMLVGISGPPAVAESANDTGPQAFTVVGEPPDEGALATLVLLESGKPINLMTDNASRPSFALIEMSIKYFVKVDGIKDVQAKINLNAANLQEIVTTYFMAMSVEEFSRFETKARVKDELKQEFNNYLISTISAEKDRRKVTEVVYDVVFSAWNYQ